MRITRRSLACAGIFGAANLAVWLLIGIREWLAEFILLVVLPVVVWLRSANGERPRRGLRPRPEWLESLVPPSGVDLGVPQPPAEFVQAPLPGPIGEEFGSFSIEVGLHLAADGLRPEPSHPDRPIPGGPMATASWIGVRKS